MYLLLFYTSSPIFRGSSSGSSENMSAPEKSYVAESSSDIKSPREPTGSGSSPRKRLKTKDETETANSNDKGIFVLEADVAEDKGSRPTMEDAWVVLHDAALESAGDLRCAHFAIYDGHGGRLAAEYAQKHLHKNVLSAGLPLGCEVCKEGYTRRISKCG